MAPCRRSARSTCNPGADRHVRIARGLPSTQRLGVSGLTMLVAAERASHSRHARLPSVRWEQEAASGRKDCVLTNEREMLRMLRGVLGTAIAWAVPWALGGGAALAVIGYASLAHLGSRPPELILEIFWNGAMVAGVIGALSGAAFACVVAVRERHTSFADLTVPRMLLWGAIGGGAIALASVGVAGIANARVLWPLLPLVGLSTALGAASATSMLWLARRGRGAEVSVTLPAGAHRTTPPTSTRKIG